MRIRSCGRRLRPTRKYFFPLSCWRSEKDNSFHNNKDVVDEWVTRAKCDGSKRAINLLSVAEGLMADDPKSRLYTWEAKMDLYTIHDVDADREKRVKHNKLCVQRPRLEFFDGSSTALHRAAQRMDWDRVIELLANGWPLSVEDSTGITPSEIINQNTYSMADGYFYKYQEYLVTDPLSQAAIAQDRLVDFRILRRDEPPRPWDGKAKYWDHLTYLLYTRYEAMYDRYKLRQGEVRCMFCNHYYRVLVWKISGMKLTIPSFSKPQPQIIS